MKKNKFIYIILFSLIVGLITGYVATKNYYQEKIDHAETIHIQQETLVETLQQIGDYFEEFQEGTGSHSFLRASINSELIELQNSATDDANDHYSKAAKLIVKNYAAHVKLTTEYERVTKLLEYYENDYQPCRVKEINNFFLRTEIEQSEELTQEELKSYSLDYIPTTGNNRDTYYLTKLVHVNTRMVIISNYDQQVLIAYFVFGNDKKAIKAFSDSFKGGDCFSVTSRLYENGYLEVKERNCKEGSILQKYQNVNY
jgi:hypothetical protein